MTADRPATAATPPAAIDTCVRFYPGEDPLPHVASRTPRVKRSWISPAASSNPVSCT